MTDTMTAPPRPPDFLAQNHFEYIDRLQGWTTNGVDDLEDGVDTQAVALQQRIPEVWGTDSCFTTSEAKNYLGRLMDFKRALLAGHLNAETPTDRERDLAALQREVEALMRQVNDLRDEVSQARTQWAADLATIGERFWQEAASRAWCSEASDFVNNLNREIAGHFPTQGEVDTQHEYSVTWDETYTVTIRRYGTFTAYDSEDAEEQAADTVALGSTYEMRSAEFLDINFESQDNFQSELSS